MKSSKEMAASVFEIRDSFLEKKRYRDRRIKKAVYYTSAVCTFIVMMVSAISLIPYKGQTPVSTYPETIYSEDDNGLSDSKIPTKMTTTTATTTLIETKRITQIQTTTPPDSTTELTDSSEAEYYHPDIEVTEPMVTDHVPESTTTQSTTISITDNVDDSSIVDPTDTHDTAITTVNSSTMSEWEDVLTEEYDADLTPEDIYSRFPEIMLDRKYICDNRTMIYLPLETVIVKTVLTGTDGSIADVVIYAFDVEGSEIAVQFEGVEDYILYRTE